jgi:hypothetical protein
MANAVVASNRPARARPPVSNGSQPKSVIRARAAAAYAEAPPRVEYALTELGRSLLEPIQAFGRWSEAHADEVLAAQERQERATNSG